MSLDVTVTQEGSEVQSLGRWWQCHTLHLVSLLAESSGAQ
jgi:hypothetical protein